VLYLNKIQYDEGLYTLTVLGDLFYLNKIQYDEGLYTLTVLGDLFYLNKIQYDEGLYTLICLVDNVSNKTCQNISHKQRLFDDS
jgi:disulfide oxidoreductase YuzD